MVDPTRTPVVTMNTATQSGAGGSQIEQLRELAWAYSQNKIAAGWTVPMSSSGNGAPGGVFNGSGNTWTTNYGTNLRIAPAGGGAWIVHRSPAGWVASGYIEELAYFDDLNADTRPTRFLVVQGYGSGAFSGGSISALPTAAVMSAPSTVPVLTPNAGAVPLLRYTTYRTARGDTRLLVKRHGVPGFNARLESWANVVGDGGGTGVQNVSWVSQAADDSGFPGACHTNYYLSGLYNNGLSDDGSTARTAVSWGVAWSIASGWVGGFDTNGEPIATSVEVACNEGAGVGRYLGRWIDFWASSQNLGWAEMFSGESGQTFRRVNTGGGFMFLPTASLPLL